ncbi:MAG: PilT/PilU family type 4a pilus ATPase [Gammaproteobacteria bacterium]|nr:PilT/PilU family type 4a pilus ATPase [Gammaproteobacteria bacterium]
MNNVEEFHTLLRTMVEKKASDLFLTAGLPPCLKIHGSLLPIGTETFSPHHVRALAYQIMNDDQRREFETTQECNFALSDPTIGRFRVNVFVQKYQVGMLLRKIETKIPSLDDLHLPPALADLAMSKRGLVVIVGATGSGKSTTLAAMIGHRNQNSSGHIITIEDPIEFIHEHAGCVITQREVGVDTQSFENALKNTLRQAPDVILIGEIRTRETMSHAIAFAETGHLCFATLHANNANQALDRIVNFFSDDRRNQLLLDLSLNLKAVVAQQLVPTPDRQGRRLALEILLNTPLIAQLIHKGEFHKLKEVMKKSTTLGMRTFDQALLELYAAGEISYEDTLHHADAPNELRLLVKLGKDGGIDKLQSALDGMELIEPQR